MRRLHGNLPLRGNQQEVRAQRIEAARKDGLFLFLQHPQNCQKAFLKRPQANIASRKTSLLFADCTIIVPWPFITAVIS
jgi:hypothetical protein